MNEDEGTGTADEAAELDFAAVVWAWFVGAADEDAITPAALTLAAAREDGGR